MSTAIDASGRLVIPKDVRDAAGLTPGTRLQVRYRGGRIEIEPLPLSVEIAREGRVAVAHPTEPVETMSAEVVRAVVGRVRDERG